MTWKELLEKSEGKPFAVYNPIWGEDHTYILIPQDNKVLWESSLRITSELHISQFNETLIDSSCAVDWFEDEPTSQSYCTCDFRGANCWLGCSCGFVSKKQEAA